MYKEFSNQRSLQTTLEATGTTAVRVAKRFLSVAAIRGPRGCRSEFPTLLHQMSHIHLYL